MCMCTLQIHFKKSVTLWCSYNAIMDHFNAWSLFAADIKKKVVEWEKATIPCKTRWDSWKFKKKTQLMRKRGRKKWICPPPPQSNVEIYITNELTMPATYFLLYLGNIAMGEGVYLTSSLFCFMSFAWDCQNHLLTSSLF